jgi:hypothetical protein
MSIEENKDVVRRWFAEFNERRWEDEAACRAPDFLAHVPVMRLSRSCHACAGSTSRLRHARRLP